MDVFGPGIGSSPPNTNAIYIPLTISQIAFVLGIIAYFWIVDFPENAEQSFHFLGKEETELAVKRIEQDRGDVLAAPFSWHEVLPHFLDPKIYAFAVIFFLLVSFGFARVCIIDCCSQKNNWVVESRSYQPFVLFTNNVSVSRVNNCFPAQAILKSICAASKVAWASVERKLSYLQHR